MFGLGDFERGVTLPIGAQYMNVSTRTEGYFGVKRLHYLWR